MQPPLRGCVLKLTGEAAKGQKNPQPPLRGCVLKLAFLNSSTS